MKTFGEIITLWPTTTAFARDVGVSPITARAWKRRGIPGPYWKAVAKAASERGYHNVTLDSLATLGARRLEAP